MRGVCILPPDENYIPDSVQWHGPPVPVLGQRRAALKLTLSHRTVTIPGFDANGRDSPALASTALNERE